MSITYLNQYGPDSCVFGVATQSLLESVSRAAGEDFLRREMHINGHWHRPPVGMRADQASHRWVHCAQWGWPSYRGPCGWRLEPRK